MDVQYKPRVRSQGDAMSSSQLSTNEIGSFYEEIYEPSSLLCYVYVYTLNVVRYLKCPYNFIEM